MSEFWFFKLAGKVCLDQLIIVCSNIETNTCIFWKQFFVLHIQLFAVPISLLPGSLEKITVQNPYCHKFVKWLNHTFKLDRNFHWILRSPFKILNVIERMNQNQNFLNSGKLSYRLLFTWLQFYINPLIRRHGFLSSTLRYHCWNWT